MNDTLSRLLLGTNNVRGNTSSTQDLFVTGVLNEFLKGFQTNDLLNRSQRSKELWVGQNHSVSICGRTGVSNYDLAIRTCCPSFHLCNSLAILTKFSQLQC